VATTLANSCPRVYTSVTRDEHRRKLFVKVVNANSKVSLLNIALDGIPGVSRNVTLVSMSGKSPNATNSIANPEDIVPVEHRIQIAGPKFEQSFAPYSMNVLELSY
jgi:alpha-L-arabinofuranosidase